MTTVDKWNQKVQSSQEAIEDFNDFSDDKAIVWADNNLKAYKEALLILVNNNSNWAEGIENKERVKFVETMIRRAEVQ